MNTVASSRFRRTTITAALPYANGPLHIGHLAGVYLPADIYARYLRLCNKACLFVCGSDEHGVAITIRARKEGISPQELIDRFHEVNQTAFQAFNISFDVYSRTSKEIHHETAQAFFLRFHETGKLREKASEQLYDPQEQMYLPDRYVTGTCPKCGYDQAYGDQCENCGSALSPTDLIAPRSVLSGAQPELRQTRHWFLPLEDYQQWLEEYILQEHQEWKTNVYGQCKSWLQEGLQARAITRDLNWGVRVPVEGAEDKRLYVWFDAPIGYISATRDWAQQQGDPEAWKKWWKTRESDGQTRLLHFIGKDNIVFHCIIFPAVLKGHGEYLVPDNVPANEFLNLEGRKISTSRNWAIWLHEFAERHPDKIDVLRYALAANMPETSDADFSWKDFQQRNNSELVAIFGNFVNRVLSLLQKYYNGILPEPATEGFAREDLELLKSISETGEQVAHELEQFRFRAGLQAAMNLARAGNRYLQEAEPWKLQKTNPERVQTILYTAAQVTAALRIVFRPFLPQKAAELAALCNLPTEEPWATLTEQPERLAPGHNFPKPTLLFQKLEDSFVEAEQAHLAASAEQPEPAPADEFEQEKPQIDFEQFMALDLRAATVLQAEKVPKTKKLIKLTLDMGYEQRTVVSGIAAFFSPEALPGQRVVVVANLAPKKMRGVESRGMVLMAEAPDGTLSFVSPGSEVPNGAVVR